MIVYASDERPAQDAALKHSLARNKTVRNQGFRVKRARTDVAQEIAGAEIFDVLTKTIFVHVTPKRVVKHFPHEHPECVFRICIVRR